jgi:thiamine-monophosphate kinase
MPERLSNIGEFELIRRISKKTSSGPSVFKGIGDDCAVLKYTKDSYLLFTTDMIVEDVHFRRRDASPEAIGHKALAVNISDIAACGGIPKWAVVSAGIPTEISYRYLSRLYQGIKRLAARFNIDIVGGDTNLSRKLVISIALIGQVKKKDLTLRSGAKDKDVIFLSGLLRQRPDDLSFLPRLKKARQLIRNVKVNSMIDISDGFFQDLGHILEEGKKGAIVYESLMPSTQKKGSYIKLLNTGEQFELIFTVSRSQIKRVPEGMYPVGEIRKESPGIIYITRDGKSQKISPRGFSHF